MVVLPQVLHLDVPADGHIAQERHPGVLPRARELINDVLRA